MAHRGKLSHSHVAIWERHKINILAWWMAIKRYSSSWGIFDLSHLWRWSSPDDIILLFHIYNKAHLYFKLSLSCDAAGCRYKMHQMPWFKVDLSSLVGLPLMIFFIMDVQNPKDFQFSVTLDKRKQHTLTTEKPELGK